MKKIFVILLSALLMKQSTAHAVLTEIASAPVACAALAGAAVFGTTAVLAVQDFKNISKDQSLSPEEKRQQKMAIGIGSAVFIVPGILVAAEMGQAFGYLILDSKTQSYKWGEFNSQTIEKAQLTQDEVQSLAQDQGLISSIYQEAALSSSHYPDGSKEALHAAISVIESEKSNLDPQTLSALRKVYATVK